MTSKVTGEGDAAAEVKKKIIDSRLKSRGTLSTYFVVVVVVDL